MRAKPDIYSTSRANLANTWATPTNLAGINSPASETRASLSWDGKMLLFGSNRGGSELDPVSGAPSNDIYYATRSKI
jgi:Tol biopolymer transport system component